MSIRVEIVCDRCAAVGTSDRVAAPEVAAYLRSALPPGWLSAIVSVRDRRSGPLDFCPACVLALGEGDGEA